MFTTQNSFESYKDSPKQVVAPAKTQEHSSIQHALQAASRIPTRHTSFVCRGCDAVANQYLNAIRYVRQSEPVECSADLLQLVSKVVDLALSHTQDHLHGYLNWSEIMLQDLWDFGKQLKDESHEAFLYPTTLNGPYQSALCGHDDYRRAIRITIYSCRAQIYEQAKETPRAMIYYRKCLAISAPFEDQENIQDNVRASLQAHGVYEDNSLATGRPGTGSSSSSFSSVSSSSSSSCANCGVEKRAMPICAKCKTQAYCSARCLVSHKAIHEPSCIRTKK
ncbi:hypothetical protein J3Q64DRAFT_1746119 [Phycomyces blakesleeanus]|uniref:MYND-type domain-containing protein n=1 Tax=Phycomyces blakesleeanus TaxID=4837 RepID=A0ABR3AZD3_PHYBL